MAFSIFTVVVLTVYLLLDMNDWEISSSGSCRTAASLKWSSFECARPGRRRLRSWTIHHVRGIGVFTIVVCLTMNVPNAVAFAVLAAFADIIPLVGAFIAIAPPSPRLSRSTDPGGGRPCALLLVYQQFEDRFLVPHVYGQTLNLPSLVVLVAVLAGGELMGIAGILLALPAAATPRFAGLLH